MKHLLLTTIAAVVLVGCGESQQSAPAPEAKPVEPVAEATKPITPPKAVTANKGADPARGIKPKPPTTKAPDISILDAAKGGDIAAVKQHISTGADVNAREKWGVTPLHWAANWGHKEIAEILIAAGADVNAKDQNDYTPLDFANRLKRTEIADLLRKHDGKTKKELKAAGK
jgi:ankyrin repeat protein